MEVALNDSYDQVAEERAAGAQPLRSGRELRLAVVAEPSLGCVIVSTPESQEADDLGSIMCEMFQLPAGAEADAVDERADAIDDHEGHGFFITGFSEALLDVVKYRAEERFGRVAVRLVGPGDPVDDGEVRVEVARLRYYGGDWKTSPTAAKASLRGALPRRSVQGDGVGHVESDSGQLGWMIPLGIVFFPIGLVPGVIVAGNIHLDHVRLAIWRGLDEAAAELMKELAAQPSG